MRNKDVYGSWGKVGGLRNVIVKERRVRVFEVLGEVGKEEK